MVSNNHRCGQQQTTCLAQRGSPYSVPIMETVFHAGAEDLDGKNCDLSQWLSIAMD